MSRENRELHRHIYEAVNVGDVEALVTIFDQGIELQSVFAAVGGAVYHGHEGARRWLGDLKDAFGGEFRVEIEAYFDLGDRTLVFGQLHGRGEKSGARVAMPAAAVATWRDGLCVSHKAYANKEDALRDAGVSEDALDPIAP